MGKVLKVAPVHKKYFFAFHEVIDSGQVIVCYFLEIVSKLVPISCSEFFSTPAAQKGITSYSSLLGKRTLLQIHQTRKTVKQFDHIINCWSSLQAFWCHGNQSRWGILRQSRPPCKYYWNFFFCISRRGFPSLSCLFLLIPPEWKATAGHRF